MSVRSITINVAVASAFGLLTPAVPALADPFFFSTGNPDGKIAVASRSDSSGKFEIEAADDFVLQQSTVLTSASFTGLIPAGSSVLNVVVEIYRVFPADSDVNRTSGSPTFSTPQVPTRVNSPSDVAFDSRDGSGGGLSFSTSVLSASFTSLNSVQPGGIHPKPNQLTGGNGPLAGEEVQFNVSFSMSLDADHYFFIPQVELDTGDFYWLSAPKPIVPPGTAFPAGASDLQSWTRDEFLDPDWLRVGTDIVGAGAFNQAFSLTGTTEPGATSVPEPGTLALFGAGLAGLLAFRRRHEPKA